MNRFVAAVMAAMVIVVGAAIYGDEVGAQQADESIQLSPNGCVDGPALDGSDGCASPKGRSQDSSEVRFERSGGYLTLSAEGCPAGTRDRSRDELFNTQNRAFVDGGTHHGRNVEWAVFCATD